MQKENFQGEWRGLEESQTADKLLDFLPDKS